MTLAMMAMMPMRVGAAALPTERRADSRGTTTAVQRMVAPVIIRNSSASSRSAGSWLANPSTLPGEST